MLGAETVEYFVTKNCKFNLQYMYKVTVEPEWPKVVIKACNYLLAFKKFLDVVQCVSIHILYLMVAHKFRK